MGRVATEMMRRLGAVEMTPRLYTIVYGMINIWKEPWQACLSKHLEAYDAGAVTGDMEYAISNLYQFTNTAIYGCGEPLGSLSQNAHSYAKRAFQCNQKVAWLGLITLHQLALDLMGVKENAYLPFSNGMTEEACFAQCRENKEISMCRMILQKKKYVAFFSGDLGAAAEMYDLSQAHFPMGPTGRLSNVLVTTFIDGLIGLFFARKHNQDEMKWTKVGLEAIRSFRKWVNSSEWNFSNKLHLLEAEYYFLREDTERAIVFYTASIKAARDHRFLHEEGLAEEKFATYLLHKNNHDDAMEHFLKSKKCYESWGAHALAQRVEKAIAILLPLCSGI